ncbi:retention module-containing protein [Halomonas sp. M1]|uniref:retention module-containing protein n=1 Tax=Halomonas sp. M1 TaxID=3035470 RepID=UPI002485EA54|nr:retention module-containing protein [Halomonas sp. M1]WFE71381.1 retention module-containing protein [Halomonas sp. M1]
MAAATIIAISGQAWARDEAGNIRELRIGDVLQEGEVLITSANGQVQLDFADGSGANVVEGGQEVAVTPELDSDLIVATEDASAMDDDLEALLSALDDDGDLLELLDATAAGAGAGGGGGGGSSFVRVARVAEETDPLAFSTDGGLDGAEFVEFGGGAVAVATDDADTVVVDTTPPTLTVDAPSGNDNTPIITGTSSEVGGTVTVIVTDAAGNTQELESVVGSDGTWSVEVTTPLAEGDYTVDASITDAAGNTGTASGGGVIDTTAPLLTIDAPSGNDTTPTINGTSDEIGGTVSVVVTDAAGNRQELEAVVGDDGTWSVEVETALAEGDYTVDASITDAAGNTGTTSDTGTVETVVSELTVTAAVDNGDATLDISGTSVDVAAGSVVAITITDQNGNTVTAQATVGADGNYLVENVNVESLTDGPLTIDAVATDNNGNTIEADTSAVLDAVESALSVNATVDNDAATLDISGSTTDVPENGVVNITITDQNGNTVTAQATVGADGNYLVENVNVESLTDGPLTIDAVATDNNGNTIEADTSAVLDAVESALSVNATVDNDAATLDISGSTTDVPENGVVNITITDQNGNTVTAQATVGADGNYLVENVNVESLTDGPLTIDAVATDNNGNTIEADTSAVLDAVESALSVNATVDNDAATLDISGSTTDVPENGVVNITITDQNGNTVTAQATVGADGNYLVENVNVESLTDGPLTIDAVATDNNGNTIEADTSAVLDAVESALSVNATVDNDAATLDISGSTTDVPENGVVNITITDQNGNTVTAQATVGADGNYLVENVNVESLTDGPLTIDAVATDNNGNTIEADTSAVLDAVESALSVNATVDNDAATLDISGSTTDVPENGVVNITITDQNGNTVTAQATVGADGNYLVENVNVESLTDGPLTIDAVATDNNGNTIEADTSAVLDAVESALSVNATVDNDAATLDISGSTTDVPENGVVNITITDQNGNTVTAQATVGADGNYLVENVNVESLTDGPLTIDAVATDNNGNTIEADTSAVLDAVESALSVNATVDNDAATLDISGSTTDVPENGVVNITITDQNGNTVTAQATVGADGNYLVENVNVESLTDGPLTIDAVATDNNGNTIEADTSAVLDAVESALSVNATVDNDAATLDISGSTTDVA